MDVTAVRLFVMAVAGWWADGAAGDRRVSESRKTASSARASVGRIRLTDEERRRLAVHGHRWPSPAPSGRDDRHTRHDSPVAPWIRV